MQTMWPFLEDLLRSRVQKYSCSMWAESLHWVAIYLCVSMKCDGNARNFLVHPWPPTSSCLRSHIWQEQPAPAQQQAVGSPLPAIAAGRRTPQVANLTSWNGLWLSLSRLLTVLMDSTMEAIVPDRPLSHCYLHNVKTYGRWEPGKFLLGSSCVQKWQSWLEGSQASLNIIIK